ncbi:unnamed protein product [Parnassius apollo]|uniref:(apollo) hypothetical protein n=1 Tax=Parnassius apollo TaxID=110799 RepID=A0A8S3XJ31_PARAO|nr:unnamed protein product [Parnassius apollo]
MGIAYKCNSKANQRKSPAGIAVVINRDQALGAYIYRAAALCRAAVPPFTLIYLSHAQCNKKRCAESRRAGGKLTRKYVTEEMHVRELRPPVHTVIRFLHMRDAGANVV